MSAPKEHAGGKPQIAVEYHGSDQDGPVAVSWVDFDFARVDSIRDLILEAARKGRAIEPIIEELVRQDLMAVRAETINRMLGFVISAEKPRLASYALAFTCNISIVENLTPAEVARRCGVSKQDVYQAVDRACEELGVRKTSWMRDEEATERMSNSNYRKVNPDA